MLQYSIFNHIFSIFSNRKQYRVESLFQANKRIPIVRSLAERVRVSCDFLTVTLFFGLLKIKTMPRSRRS
jgi:hypothetical protein